MADVKSNDTTPVNTAIKMKVDGSAEECPSPTKQDNSTSRVGKVEEFKVCSPSNPFKTASTNPFASEHNKISKSILKPSLLSVNSSPSASCNFILRQSGFNPFNNKSATNDTKSDNSDKKQINGEVLKFVPLIKSDSQLSKSVESTQSNNATNTTSSTPTFVFGQNLQARVMSDANSSEPSPSTSSINSNGDSSGTSDMLFSSAIKSDVKSDVSKETKSLTESAREYEESRANKRKYDEVQVKTGEEEETNILSISCKLFSFDKVTTTWQERGRGTLRLNDFEVDDGQIGSRLVFRTTGSLRVILNTKIWAEMTADKASEKSIRLTALDSSGEVRVFLIMSSIDDCRQLYSYLQSRLEKEVALQKRKKLATDDSGEK